MLQIEHNPKLKTLNLELESDVAESFEGFVEYCQEEHPHATNGLVLRAILKKVVHRSSHWQGFRTWKSEKEAESAVGDEAEEASEAVEVEGGKKSQNETVESEASEESEARVSSPGGREEEDGDVEARESGAAFTAKTGSVKADQHADEEKEQTGRRRIQRGSKK